MDIGTRRDGSSALYVRLDEIIDLLNAKADDQTVAATVLKRPRDQQTRKYAAFILRMLARDLEALEDD